ncbi:hypothetical protein [Haploplasma modicum]|uniref:hypothetical protein n=1 Tax=Haploplasma modicum TaxID=2150 RepID=UPI000478FCC3|nr:hypothetical protein [Haploplasma modicum]
MEIKTVREIYYDNLKTGLYKVFDNEENLRFNLGAGIVYIIVLDQNITKKDFSYQLALKDNNVYFRTSKNDFNLKFVDTLAKINFINERLFKIETKDFNDDIKIFFEELSIKEIKNDISNKIFIEYTNNSLDSISPFSSKNSETIKSIVSPFSKGDSYNNIDSYSSFLENEKAIFSRNVSASPFKIVSKGEYLSLNEDDKEHNELYIINEGNLEVNPINKFVLITFKDEVGNLIKSNKVEKNTNVIFPLVETFSKTSDVWDYRRKYRIFRNWIFDNKMVFSPIIADRNKEVIVTYDHITTSNYYKIKMTGNIQKRMDNSFEVISDRLFFVKTENYLGYQIIPEVVFSGLNQDKYVFNLDFKINGLVSKPGRTEIIPLKITLYQDEIHRSEYGKIELDVIVIHESNSSSGD